MLTYAGLGRPERRGGSLGKREPTGQYSLYLLY